MWMTKSVMVTKLISFPRHIKLLMSRNGGMIKVVVYYIITTMITHPSAVIIKQCNWGNLRRDLDENHIIHTNLKQSCH